MDSTYSFGQLKVPGKRFVRSARLVRVYGRCGSGLTHGMADPKHWMGGEGWGFDGRLFPILMLMEFTLVESKTVDCWLIEFYGGFLQKPQSGFIICHHRGEISVAQLPHYDPLVVGFGTVQLMNCQKDLNTKNCLMADSTDILNSKL